MQPLSGAYEGLFVFFIVLYTFSKCKVLSALVLSFHRLAHQARQECRPGPEQS